jgi:uncharacterized membrane protein YphA (DoxX/SURF4 family)
VKGLSRLPVTEEIAGSNPVESAKKDASPLGGAFFLPTNTAYTMRTSAIISVMTHKKIDYAHLDVKIISFFRRIYIPTARFSIFLIFFWFGIIKLLGLSPASPLAEALTAQTIGMQHFNTLFILLSLMECVIGILFLFPKMTRIVIPLLLVHMVLVCSPLVILPAYVWQQPFVPTLEGQYILKNAVVVAVAIGIAASAQPLTRSRS